MFDLNGLSEKDLHYPTAEEFKKHCEELDCIEAECKKKYGDDWQKYYLDIVFPSSDIDTDLRSFNRAIYGGYMPSYYGLPKDVHELHEMLHERIRVLFNDRDWMKYLHHEPGIPEINEVLINDALRTGMWRELPDELQDEYHRRAGDKDEL